MIRHLRTASNALLSLVSPTSCWVSGRPVTDADHALAADLREQIARGMLMPFCPNCGATAGQYTAFDRDHPCHECAQRQLNIASIVRVGTYDDPLAALIKTLKFSRRHEVAEILGVYLHQAISMHTRDGKDPRVDAILPIPLHWWRHWMRGFNQAEEISRTACKLGHWPMLKPLWRIHATMPQSVTTSRTARNEHMAGVFWCQRTSSLAGKHIWLVDDVCTTGATLRSAATAIRKLPRKLQPASIHAAVIAITDHRAVSFIPEPEEL